MLLEGKVAWDGFLTHFILQSSEKFDAKKANRREKIEANISFELAKRNSFRFISIRS
jgi:hypothetical protein